MDNALKKYDDNTIPSYIPCGDGYVAVWVGDRLECTEEQKRLRPYDETETELTGPWLNVADAFDVSWLILDLTKPTYARMLRTPLGTFVWEQNIRRIGDVQGT
jgi:hypothetical protein